MTKEKFLNLHIDDLQKQIWLMEIDLIAIQDMIRSSKNKEEIDKFIQLQNKVSNQIRGNESRIQLVQKVIHGTISIKDSEESQNFVAK